MAPFSWTRWLRSLFRPKAIRTIRNRRRRSLHVEGLETRLAPATFTWTGLGGTTGWSDPKNWQGGLVAPSGSATTLDDLVFPSGPSKLTANDNLSGGGGTFGSITIAAKGYDLTGEALTLNPSPTDTASVIVGAGASGAKFDFTGLTLASANQFFDVGSGADLTIKSPLTADVGTSLSKEQAGTLILSADNSNFSGTITVDFNGGILQITNPKALGNNTFPTVVQTNGQLQLNLPAKSSQVAENLTLNGSGVANDGALLNVGATGATVSGTVELDSDVSFGNNVRNTKFPPLAPDAALDITGFVTDLGAGHNVTKVGVGEVIFGAANSYRGTTTIQNGVLDIQNPLALGTGDGSSLTAVTVNQKAAADGTILSSGTLRLDFVNNLAPTDPNGILQNPNLPYDAATNPFIGFLVPNKLLTLNGAGDNGALGVAIGAIDNGAGSNTWTGNVILGSLPPDGQPPALGAESFDPYYPLTLSGVLSSDNGAFTVTKVGAGTVILTSPNTYTGNTVVAAGILEITDSTALGNTPQATVLSGGSLELSTDGKSTDSVTGVANELNVSVPLFISGLGANLKGALFSDSGINTYSGPITLQGASAAIGVSADPNTTAGPAYFTSDYSLTVTGQIVSKAVVTLVTNDGAGNVTETITVTATKLLKVEDGQLILPNANLGFQGSVDIQGGWITVENSNSLGSFILGVGVTQQPVIAVEAGAALQLDAPGGSINVPQNLSLRGIGFIHSYGLINQMGAVENIAGTNTLSGNVALNGPVGIGVENVFPGIASDLTMTGSMGAQAGKNAITLNATASGGSMESDNVIDTGATSGTVTVNYQMYYIPDSLDIYYGDYPTDPNAVDIANTGGKVSGTGTLTVNYAPIGPYSSTDITLVMDQGGGLSGTAWTYTATIVPKASPSSAGGIVKLGSQKLNIQGDGTYTGAVDIQAGVLRNQNDTGLGSGGNNTTVEAGTATIQQVSLLDGTPGTTNIQLTLTMPGGAPLVTGNIPYAGSAGTGATPDALAIQSALNTLPAVQALGGGVTVMQLAPGLWNVTFGGAMLSFDELLTATVSGTGLESISTTVEQHGAGGALELGLTNPGNTGGVTRGVQVAGEHLILNGQGDPAFNDAPLTVVAGSDQMWRGPVTLNNDVPIQIPATSRLSLEGVIDDANVKSPSGAGFTMTQGGELNLGGSNTFRGTVNVNQGVLTVQNSQALGGSGVADVQTITLAKSVVVGTTFALQFGTATTATITYNGVSAGAGSDANQIQTVLQNALTAAGIQGTVTVTEVVSATKTTFTVTFGGALVGFDQPQLALAAAPAPPDPTDFAFATVTDGAGGTIVANGAALRLEGNITVAGEPLIVQGQGVATSPNVPLQWFNVGPASQQGGEGGNVTGRVTGIAVDPSDSNVIYIATAGGGAWKTINGGQTWLPIFDASYALYGGSIAVAPSDPRIIYYGTGEADNSGDSFSGTGVYESTDAGRTWALVSGGKIPNPMKGLAVSKIVVDPGNAGTIFVATSDLQVNGEQQTGAVSTVGVWRFMSNQWFNLTSVTSFQRSSAGGVSGAPNTPGPDDDFTVSFPQSGATWSDLALVGSSKTNNLILYAALGTDISPLTGTGDPANGVYRCEDLQLLSNSPTWYEGDDTVTNGKAAKNSFPTNTSDAVTIPPEEFPQGTTKLTAFIVNAPVPYILLPAPIYNPVNTGPPVGNAAVVIFAAISYPDTYFNPTLADNGIPLEGTLWKIYTSVDGGQTWNEIKNEPLTLPNGGPDASTYLGNQGNYDNTIFTPDGKTLYVAGQEFAAAGANAHQLWVQVSTDGGATASWTKISVDSNGNFPHTDAHALALDGANILLGTDGGVWSLTTKGDTWTNINSNLGGITANGVATDPNNPNIIYTGSQDNGVAIYNGTTWTSTNVIGDAGFVRVNPQNPSIIYVVQGGVLQESIDGGATWNVIYPDPLDGNEQYFPFAIDQVNPSRLVVGGVDFGLGPDNGNILMESLNGGATWHSLGAPSGNIPPQITSVEALGLAAYQGTFQADPAFGVTDLGANTYDPGTMYIFGRDGNIQPDGLGLPHLYVTKNYGTTWLDRTAGLPATISVADIVVDPRNSNTVYLVDNSPSGSTFGRVFETTNGGQSWTDITHGLPNVPTWTIVIDPRTGFLYVGDDEGVFESTNGGGSWLPFGAGLPAVQVHDLELNQNLNVLTAATYGRGVYQIALADIPANSGAISAGSGTSVWTGRVQLAGPTAIGAYATPIVTNGIVGPQLNIVGTISDLILGTQSDTLSKVGPGNVILSGNNTYSGLTDVQTGALIVHNPNALGANPSTAGNPGLGTIVEPGAALKLQSSVVGEPLTLQGNGAGQLNGHNTGALENASGNNTYAGPITLATFTTIGVDSGSSLDITGIIGDGNSPPDGLTKQLSGTLILDAENTYSGGTLVDQGAVSIQSPHGLGANGTNTVVDNGAQLQVQGGIEVPSETLTLSGTGIFGTGALEGVGGANIWDGTITLAQIAPLDDPPSSPSSNPPANIGFGVLFTSPSDSLTITGQIKEATPFLGVNKVDAGTLILDNETNNYSGATIVSNGAIRVQQSGALGTPGSSSNQGVIVSGTGGSFTLTYNGQTTGPLASGATALQVQTALNFLSSISGVGGSVSVSGSGVYSVNFGGTLGGGNALPLTGVGSSGAIVTMASNGTFVQPGGAIEVDGDPTGVGASLAVSGEGLTINGNGAPEVQQVTVLATAGTFNLSFGVKSTSALAFNASAAQVQSALDALTTIGGAGGSVIVTQAAVTGGSVYTVIFGGSLANAHQPLLGVSLSGVPAGSSANVIIARDGGTGSLHNVTGNNSWTGPVVLQSADSIGVDPGTQLTLSGVVEDPATAPVPAASVTKVGAGTLVFPGDNLYTGKTIVNNGILNIQSSSTASSSPLGAVVSQIDSVNVAGPITGTFTLTFNGKTTGSMGVTASAAQVQGQLQFLSTIGAGNVAVTKTGSTFTVTFQGALAGMILPPLTGSGLGGAVVTITTVQNGSEGTVVNPGATLQMAGNITMSTESLILNGTGASEVQQVVLSDTTPADTFTLSFNNQTTLALAPNAGAPAVQAALDALSTIGGAGGFVNVVQTPSSGNIAYTIAFGGSLAGAPQGLLQVSQPNAGTAPTVTELQIGGIGALDSSSGNNTWDTPITLAGNTAIGAEGTVGAGTLSMLTIDQAIGQSVASTLTKVGSGTALLSGTSSNTYSGLTSVTGGLLELGKSSGLAVPVNLTIGNGLSAPGSDTAQLEGNGQLLPTAVVTVNSDGIFDLNNNQQTVGALKMTGGTVELTGGTSVLTLGGNVTAQADPAGNPAAINSAGTLDLGGVNRTITVNGPAFTSPAVADMVISTAITGTAGVTKAGAGTLQLTGSNPALNATINAGAVLADATGGNTLGAVTLDTVNAATPALLGGNGTVADITPQSAAVGGTVQPGDGPNAPEGLNNQMALSTVPVSGTDTWNSATNLSLVLDDSSPGDYSQLAVTGNINLGGTGSVAPSKTGGGGASLSGFIGTLGTGVNIGDTFTILTTTGTVSGRFAEPEGEVTPGGLGIAFVGGQKFTVQYNPSSVVLQAVMENATVALTASVASTSTTPVYGQDVVFTATVTPEAGAGVIPNSDLVAFSLDGGVVTQQVTLNNGKATFDPAGFSGIPLGVGPHTIDATFLGDNNFNSVAAPTLNETVKQANTTISVSALPVNPVPGQGVVVTATILPVKPGGAPPAFPPSGTATFIVDGVALASGPVTLNPNGQAITTLTFPQASVHTVKVTYSGDTNYKGVSTTTATTINVVKGNPTVQVAATPLTSSYGQSVLFQVTVSGPITPTGNVAFYNGPAVQVNSLGSVTLDSNGQGSVSTAILAAGQHTITAVYAGNTSFNAATGLLQNFLVSQASTQTTLNVVPTTSAFGQPVTLSATVAVTGNGAGTPTGTVKFFDGATALNAGTLVNLSGKATFVTATPLSIGTHNLSAQYSGSANFAAGSPSNTVVETVQVGTGLTVTSSANPSVYGQAINLTATLKPLSSANIATASGETLTFFDGPANTGILLGSANLNSSGVAVLPGINSLAVDVGNVPHTITVTYGGDSTFLATTGTLSQTVNRSSTTTKLTASANPSPFGSPITFSVSVVAAGNGVGIPSGTVNFYDGSAIPAHLLGSGGLDVTGFTTFTTTTNLTIGVHVITAVYADDTNFATSQTTLSETIKAAATTTSLTVSDLNPVFSESLVLTATVASAGGNPTGTVNFYDGAVTLANKIGSGTLSTTLGVTTATFTTTSLSVATHNLNAAYVGTANFGASQTISATAVTVGQDTITPTITSSINPSAQNSPVTFSVTVSADAPGTATPTGTVSFYDDTGKLPGAGTLLNATAAPLKATNVTGVALATFSTSSLSFGPHTIDAFYNGSAGFASSTSGGGTPNIATMTQTVLFGDTVSVSVAPANSVFGLNVNVTATINPIPSGMSPTGSVIFYDGPVANGNAISPAELVSTSGGVTTASFGTTGLTAGTHHLFAAYSGDPQFVPNNSAAPGAQEVVAQSTTQTQIFPPSNSTPVYGTTVTISAVVSAVSGAGTPTGSVTFYDGAKALSPAVALDNTGTATLMISTLSAGTQHNISAKYTGDTNFQASLQTGTVPVTPTRATSSIALSSSVDTSPGSGVGSSVYSQKVTFTVVVSNGSVPGGGNAPTGKVTFLLDGTTVIGGAPVTLDATGTATVSISTLSVGTLALPFHTITATYADDTNYTGSATGSAGADQITVSQDATNTTVSAPSSAFQGQAVTLSATVAAASPGTGTPTAGESVTFYDGSIAPANKIGTGTLNSSGVATLVTSSLTVGLHNINVSYAGDSNFFASQTSVAAPVTISPQLVQSFSATAMTGITPNSPFSFKVTALDGNGHQVMSDNNAVSIALVSGPAGGTLTGNFNGTFVNGVFTFTNLKVNKLGTYKIRITSNGVSTVVTLVVSVGGGRFT